MFSSVARWCFPCWIPLPRYGMNKSVSCFDFWLSYTPPVQVAILVPPAVQSRSQSCIKFLTAMIRYFGKTPICSMNEGRDSTGFSFSLCGNAPPKQQADDIFQRAVSPAKMRNHREYWPTGFHKKDRLGRPVFYDRVGQSDLSKLRAGSDGLDQDEMVQIFTQNMEVKMRGGGGGVREL